MTPIFRFRAAACLAAGILLAAAGCDGSRSVFSAETDDAGYREGQRLEKEGRPQEALAAYLKVIAQRGDQAPESHLDVGLLDLDQFHDPIAAIYHFRRYLELEPASAQAGSVRGLIVTAERDFARTLPAQPLESQTGDPAMIAQVARLEQENTSLKAELEALRPGSAPEPPPAAPSAAPADAAGPVIAPAPETASEAAAPAPAAVRTHTVTHGDTLYSLAQHYYGSRSRWRDILAANRDQLPDEHSHLRIGMVLKIP